MYQNYNPNPKAARVGDCVIRAISKLTDQSWERTFIMLCVYGFMLSDLPSANHVWGRYLKDNGYTRDVVPDTCLDCYTVQDFANDHKTGEYLLALNGHVVTVINGDWFDTWDSANEIVVYYWHKRSVEDVRMDE